LNRSSASLRERPLLFPAPLHLGIEIEILPLMV